MIIEFILGGFKSVVEFMFGWLPSIPELPSVVIDGISWFNGSVAGVVGVVSWLYTPVFFGAIMMLMIAVLIFDPVYNLALWVWHKIRG